MTMIRFCPHCQTERPLTEIFCAGQIKTPQGDNQFCGWDLTLEAIHETGWRPIDEHNTSIESPKLSIDENNQNNQIIEQRVCVNGHSMDEGDFICLECGADAALELSNIEEQSQRLIGNWRLERRINQNDSPRERYLVTHIENDKNGVLTLYQKGEEPDPTIYQVLQLIPTDHVPEFYETGRWENRAWHVTELLEGGSLSQFIQQGEFWQLHEIPKLVEEMGQAIAAFTEHGLRHRNLCPANLLIRSREPLDIVVIEYGSASLSEFDLDIVTPLDISRYSAPETLAGGVSAASDWWSLGVILLEQLTQGQCFAQVHDNAFLIQVMTNGVDFPDDLDPNLQLLLRGLLCRDRFLRWQWPQVSAWLEGKAVQAPQSAIAGSPTQYHQVQFAGQQFSQPDTFAMVAGEQAHWDGAVQFLLRGELTSWLAKFDNSQEQLKQLQAFLDSPKTLDGAFQSEINQDIKLTLALKILNPNMPFIYRGEIITPAWLLEQPILAYALISEPLTQHIQNIDPQHWLVQLYHRQCLVRQRAEQLNILLNEESLKLYLLITSISQLAARWELLHSQFPDSHNESLQALLDRQNLQEIDYILLLSADIGQFISLTALVEQSFELAKQNDIHNFDSEIAKNQLLLPRGELYLLINHRVSDFKRIGIPELDGWVDDFLLMRRLPLVKILVLLAIPFEHWQVPESQKYVLEVLRFFTQKLTSVTQRGNLVRMRLTQNTGRVDLMECDSPVRPASALLEHLLNRKKSTVTIDSDLLLQHKGVNGRLRILQSDTQLYQRDTGIDGMYLGFPFLLLHTQPNQIKPRIAPLFLWPVSLRTSLAQNSPIQLSFDHERAAIRLNPALASFAGIPPVSEWQTILDNLLSKAGLTIEDMMETLTSLLPIQSTELAPLPSITTSIAENSAQICCSAVLFHTSFIGQAMSSDLQQIAGLPISQTALATMLKVSPLNSTSETQPDNLLNQYALSLADPSQEQVVQAVQANTGLLIEGPPGTGKSQTIVSLIADAIGRQQTVLVVCQKPAALEVVYKRLIANGLGDRALYISQSQKGREIILTVREQIEQLWGQEKSQLVELDWQGERIHLVNRVQLFEQKIDRYFHSLNNIDEKFQVSYKQVLSQLIELEKLPHFDIDEQHIKPSLAQFDSHTIEQLTDDLKSHAYTWWQLDYENNALKALSQFTVNDPQYLLFNQSIMGLIDTEKQRDEAYKTPYQQITLTQLSTHEQWLSQHEAQFSQLTAEQWQGFSRWLTLFSSETGNLVINQLELLYQRLLSINEENIDPLLFPVFRGIDNDHLSQLSRALMETMQGSWLRFLNPYYYRRQNQLQSFMAASGLAPTTEKQTSVLNTIAVEQQWRLLERELQPLYQQLGLELQPNHQWRSTLQPLVMQLKRVADMAELLTQYPEPLHFIDAITQQQKAGFIHQCHEVRAAIAKLRAKTESLNQLSRLDSVFSSETVERFKMAIVNGESNTTELVLIAQQKENLQRYQSFREETQHFTEQHWGILTLLKPAIGQLIATEGGTTQWRDQLIQTINYYFCLFTKAQLQATLPALSTNHGQLMSDLAELENAQKQLQQFNKLALTTNIDIKTLGNRREWEEITRLAGPRARRLREFIQEGRDIGLMQLRPVWLMTPDVASQVLPLEGAMFDSVIYDEASQMPIEFALSTLFRAKQAIVSGDEKQMPPSKFFTGKQIEDDIDEEDDDQQELAGEQWDYRQISDCPDLLHLARTVLPIHTLDIHYRSAYRELINFSNFAFYENRLNIPAQFSSKMVSKIKPLQLIQVNGTYVNQSNEAEAVAIVDHLASMWQRPFEQRPSVGVVTFNQKQATLINQIIQLRAAQDEDFLQAYTQENQRTHNDEDMSFFVKNVENVQGDERDVILFSTTFGRNAQGTFRRNFGVLGQTGGERRLNVAITRARQQVVIMSSMPIDEISDLLATYRKPEIPRDYLQGYLAYALNACNPLMQKENKKLLSRMCHTQSAVDNETLPQNAFVDSVMSFIRQSGWQVTTASQNGVFHFDGIVEDRTSGRLLIGIECDIPSHPLLKTARSRELWRSAVLARVIPARYRVSIIEWYQNRDLAQQQLHDAISQALLTSSLSQIESQNPQEGAL
ncbi:AAA domain-containing protein [Providencia rettgeri]|uniref:protein kinase domain-containing protein n=1 Tax=Providencia hangzhouensis TaxID=3031799 RepID=UPI0032DC8C0E